MVFGCVGPEPSEPVAQSAPDNEYSKQLAEKFCPIIYLDDEGDIIEHYEPVQVEILIENAFIRDINNPSFSEQANIANLLQWSNYIYYLDILNLEAAIKSTGEYETSYDSIKSHYQPTVYTRLVENPDEDYTIIQYWMFYYCNDWRNFHEGDWELVQLNFPGKTIKNILETGIEPVFAAYSQHQGGQRMAWVEMKEAGIVKDTHPVVHVAQGSHANYFVPGNYWSGLDFDDTGLTSWRIIAPDEIDVSSLASIENDKDGKNWLDFRGYWGEYLSFSISILELKFWQHGPFGPPWNEKESRDEKWDYPNSWAIKLPEFPKPFWTRYLEIPGDWLKLAVFSLFSPADLHVYDVMGRHVGLDEKGELETEIPGAIYISPEGTDYKIVLIPDTDVSQEYKIITEGNDSGIMDIKIQVPDERAKSERFLEYLDVPVLSGSTARATIKPVAFMTHDMEATDKIGTATARDTVTMLELDYDGDGTFELEIAPGKYTQD